MNLGTERIDRVFNDLKSRVRVLKKYVQGNAYFVEVSVGDIMYFDKLDDRLYLNKIYYEYEDLGVDLRRRYEFALQNTEAVWHEEVTVNQNVLVPGTDLMIEAGDKIRFACNESSNVPAIGQVVAPAALPNITSVVRKDSVYNTCVAMGLPTKINAMKNVVVSVGDMQEAAAVLQTIYEQFGLKGSFMVTWEGNGKVYFDPRTPVDTKKQLAYAKSHNMALPSTDPRRLIGY